jgi:hypothetical protein
MDSLRAIQEERRAQLEVAAAQKEHSGFFKRMFGR